MIELLLVMCLSCAALVVLIVFIPNCVRMYKERNRHHFPSVTRCRLCNKRVWAWHRYERRQMHVRVDKLQQVSVGISGSALVHLSCQGNPVSNVQVRAG